MTRSSTTGRHLPVALLYCVMCAVRREAFYQRSVAYFVVL